MALAHAMDLRNQDCPIGTLCDPTYFINRCDRTAPP